MTLTQAQDICLNITMQFEGTGFDRVIGNFDGSFLTFGCIGFTLKYGTLQNVLKQMYHKDPKLFGECCTVFVPIYNEKRDLTPLVLNMLQLSNEEAGMWALQRQSNNFVLAEQWVTLFKNLGEAGVFQQVQREEAYKSFIPALSHCKEYNLETLRGLMLFYDFSVQQGNFNPETRNKINDKLKAVTDYKKKLFVIAKEMSNQASLRWRLDVYRRRMTIVNGFGKVHGKYYNLNGDFHLSDEKLES